MRRIRGADPRRFSIDDSHFFVERRNADLDARCRKFLQRAPALRGNDAHHQAALRSALRQTQQLRIGLREAKRFRRHFGLHPGRRGVEHADFSRSRGAFMQPKVSRARFRPAVDGSDNGPVDAARVVPNDRVGAFRKVSIVQVGDAVAIERLHVHCARPWSFLGQACLRSGSFQHCDRPRVHPSEPAMAFAVGAALYENSDGGAPPRRCLKRVKHPSRA